MTDKPTGRVLRPERITRQMVRDAHVTAMFVFGDNMIGQGLGGQAAEMRGEPNTIGVPTKWAPGTQDSDYFSDADLQNDNVRQAISSAFEAMRAALAAGLDVAIPAGGLGTGLAELPTRAPQLHAWIEANIASLEQRS